MAYIKRANLVSTELSGDTTILFDKDRSYFFIAMVGESTGTIEFGHGGGEIPLAAQGHYTPCVVPTSDVTIRTSGDFIVITSPPPTAVQTSVFLTTETGEILTTETGEYIEKG